jgi:branched-chain amino acid transport system ATP-binding protein
LHYYYGNIHALKGINLKVEEGEIVTLIGSNGAGKTTALRTLSGLNSPKGVCGGVIFNGKKITGLKGHVITGMGMAQVLEGRRIFPKLTVMENIQMGAYLRKDKKAINAQIENELFTLFPRLNERRNALGGTLSGGEQEMLAIARAMINSPKLLLLDEPSMGLGPLVIHEIFVSIKKLRERGTTIMFVEQNSKVAFLTADRGYVIQTGEIIMEDTCENLANNPEIKKAYLGG